MEHLGARRVRLHSESEASGALDSQGKRTDSGRSRTDMRELKTAQNSPAPSTLASPIKSPNYADHIEEDNYPNTSRFATHGSRSSILRWNKIDICYPLMSMQVFCRCVGFITNTVDNGICVRIFDEAAS